MTCRTCYRYSGEVYRLEAITISPTRILGSTLVSATLGALLSSAIYGQFPPQNREEWGRFIASFVSSGFAGLLLALIAAATSGG